MKQYELKIQLVTGFLIKVIFTGFANEDVCDYQDLTIYGGYTNEVINERCLLDREYKQMETEIYKFLDTKFEELYEDYMINYQYKIAD